MTVVSQQLPDVHPYQRWCYSKPVPMCATVYRMKTASVLVIKRRGEPIAELRPISKRRVARRLPDLTSLWRRFPGVVGDSGRFLEEER
jgi:hypothetical protein